MVAAAFARFGGGTDVWYSLGLRISGEGTISDVRWNGPADKSRLAPGYKVLAINGRTYSSEALLNALRAAKGTSEPIHLVVQSESYVNNFDIDYHDGERYPVLERVEGTPAYLDDITKPLTTPEKAPETKKEE
jgi:predicted metalloprotease with PDZ domain